MVSGRVGKFFFEISNFANLVPRGLDLVAIRARGETSLVVCRRDESNGAIFSTLAWLEVEIGYKFRRLPRNDVINDVTN